MNEGSAEGLSRVMYYLDFIMLSQVCFYSLRQGFPLNVFGETIFLGIQDAIVIFLIWNYQPGIPSYEKLLFLIFPMMIYPYLLITADIPKEQWELVVDSSTLLIIGSRSSQIYLNCVNSSTGAQHFFPFFMNWLGSIARLYTVIVETDSLAFMVQTSIAWFLLSILCLQFYLYGSNPAKPVEEDVEN